jgi:hypothetical protein
MPTAKRVCLLNNDSAAANPHPSEGARSLQVVSREAFGVIDASGEGGIRTLGALLELGALAKLCFRPLSHLTIEAREPKYSGIYGKRQTPNGQWIGALSNN